MTIMESGSTSAPWVIRGVVAELLDSVVSDFWTGALPAAQEMGLVLEQVRASLARVRIPTTLLRGVVRVKHQRFVIEVYNKEGLVTRRSYDRLVPPADEPPVRDTMIDLPQLWEGDFED